MVEPRLRIAEIFTSLQGEGIWSGIPSTFIRVSGCNLRCVWCDTPYASWNPEGPVQTVAELLADPSVTATRHVVLTGGEPMLFDAIEALAQGLRQRDHIITIETAGTVFRDLPCDLISISPKLTNSTPGPETGERERHEALRYQPSVVQQLISAYPHQLKFVVNPDEGDDLSEIDAFLGELTGDLNVLLMPEGIDAETLWRRARLLVPVCLARGWRLSPRLHVDLFGHQRGT